MRALIDGTNVQLRWANRAALAALFLASVALRTLAATVHVPPGTNLQTVIDHAQGGDTLLLETGEYPGFKLRDRHFTEQEPLTIKAAERNHPVIRHRTHEGYLAHIEDCSYVVFDGVTFEGSNQPIYCKTIDHFIFVRLEIHNTGQEAIHIRGQSHHVDIRDCRIHDTGHWKDQWCEGIYLGMGQPPFEAVEYVWIEGNEIFDTAHSEGINLKARCRHITVRGNRVHDLAPGTDTQHNEAGISCEAADRSFRPGEDTDIWIERNEIYNIRFGRWANGIQATTMGPRIVGNRIHDCAQYGIEFNAYDNGPGSYPVWVYGNTFARCGAGDSNSTPLTVKRDDPGQNPNSPQSWYR